MKKYKITYQVVDADNPGYYWTESVEYTSYLELAGLARILIAEGFILTATSLAIMPAAILSVEKL